MNTTLRILAVTLVTMLLSCNTKQKQAATDHLEKKEVAIEKNEPSKETLLTAATIAAHGGELYENAHYSFSFRNKTYTFKNSKNSYRYSVKKVENTHVISDVLENEKLTRFIEDKVTPLSEKDIAIHTEALNSVIYFATLPHKLKDKAVHKKYEGTTTVKGQAYELLGVSFAEEGGGKDYDDKFLYWINSETKTIEYLAYSYSTNNGGVRFRSAFNPRTVKGIRFQDYINYEVPIGTPLKDIGKLYEKGTLKELSKILTENVRWVDQ